MNISSLFSAAAFQERANRIQEKLDTEQKYAFAGKTLLWLNASLNWLLQNPPLETYRFVQLDPSQPDPQKISRIGYAILNNEEPASIEALIESGENVNQAGSLDATPIAMLLEKIKKTKKSNESIDCLENTLQKLVKAGAQIDKALIEEAQKLELSKPTIELLIVNLLDENDETPLMQAARKDTPDALDEVFSLLRKGASPLTISKNGNSPLSSACEGGNLLIVNQLLVRQTTPKKNIINRPNTEGVTPLMVGAKAGQKNVVSFLLKEGASLSALDKNEKSALTYAVENNHPNSTRTLLTAKTFYGKSGESMLNNTIALIALSPGHEKAKAVIEDLAPNFLKNFM